MAGGRRELGIGNGRRGGEILFVCKIKKYDKNCPEG